MIKYIGSKRLLVPVLGAIASAVGARTALDLFTGTTRVAQELKRRGIHVTAVDTATYAEALARCFIETHATADHSWLSSTVAELDALPGDPGYFTQAFCEQARYLQPSNGARVDAIREAIRSSYGDNPILLTALMLAADKVDSTTGVQMAYLKQWAPRSHKRMTLLVPDLITGAGSAIRGDAMQVIEQIPDVDLAYLDPPYNQHRYFTNYHVWESLIRWDKPEGYGIANKRVDSRDEATRSVFNSRREMPAALRSLILRTRAQTVVVSYNDESWVSAEEISGWLRDAGHEAVAALAFDAKRYVGAQIGIHDPSGRKVGTVSHTRNTEYVIVAGSRSHVAAATAAATAARTPV